MSMFICDRCDGLRDSDDGCAEAASGLHLICIYCMEDDEAAADEEAEDRRRANPLEPDFRKFAQ